MQNGKDHPHTEANVDLPALILVVEDNPITRKSVRVALQVEGYRVVKAEDGRSALEQMRAQAPDLILLDLLLPDIHGAEALAEAQREPPDLIVCDVLMPHMDGFDLCLAVRHESRLNAVPVIMVSANYLEETDQRLGTRVGASAFVYREQGFDSLLQAVLGSLARPVPTASASTPELDTERHVQIVRQLERQMSLHAASAQRNIVQSAILHELGLIAETLAKRKDLASALDEILAYCLDGAGLSKGILYLTEADAQLSLRAQYGCTEVLQTAQAFFGLPDIFQHALRTGDSLMIPSTDVPAAQTEQFLSQAQAKSALIVPVRSGEKDMTVLLLLSLHRDLLDEDWLSFGRALASQIGQSVALSHIFYRLSESEQRYRSLFEAANDGIYVTDDEGCIKACRHFSRNPTGGE